MTPEQAGIKLAKTLARGYAEYLHYLNPALRSFMAPIFPDEEIPTELHRVLSLCAGNMPDKITAYCDAYNGWIQPHSEDAP